MLVQGVPATTANVSLRMSVLGEVQLDRAIAGRVKLTSDFSPAFAKMADDFEDMEEEAFANAGAYEGNPQWAWLSIPYARRKMAMEKKGTVSGTRILVLTGALRDSLTGGKGSVRDITAFELRVGGSVRVGRWDLGGLHQTGTRRMPARKPVNLSRRRKSRWIRFLKKHLQIEGMVS